MNKITLVLFTFLFSLGLFSQETSVTGFVLVNADTDTDIIEITEGMAVNLRDYPDTQFSIRANADGEVKSIRLELSGPVAGAMTENVAPYALFGDVAGDFNGKTFLMGSYVMEATPYDAPNLGGNVGRELSIDFSFVDEEIQRPFITTWKTDNPGISQDNQIIIPTYPNETYNYTIDWGDGNSNSGLTGNIAHTYETPGTYQISISGDFPSIWFNDPFNNENGDADKIVSIDQWGDIDWKYVAVAYAGCDNLDVKATDIPDFFNVIFTNAMFLGCKSLVGNETMNSWNFESVTSMNSMFADATSFNQDIGNWDVSNVTDFVLMFSNTSFDQNLENWNVGNAQDMAGMFNGVALSNENYDSLLNGWSTQQLQNGVSFSGGNSQYCQGEGPRQKLIDDFGWTITDGGKTADCPDNTSFITTWKTDNPGVSEDNQITIHTSPSNLLGSYNYSVDWGDGTSTSGVTEDINHTYDTPGIYQISISGTFPAVSFGIINGEQKDNLKLLEVNQWGGQQWSDLNGAFDQCTNLDVVATDIPDLTNVNFMGFMFRGCESLTFNETINSWDVSNVNFMWSMFSSCGSFNQDISNWDVSNVSNMDAMFLNSGFNQDISNWNVSNVSSMNQMFSRTPFNQDIGDWDVSKVTDMGGMFRVSPFNQDIGNWNVSNVSNMSIMFDQNFSFNQNLGNWNVSALESIEGMFSETSLSIENYDALLNGWSVQQLQSGVTFDAGNSQFCLGKEARQKLIDDFGWTITDGGKTEDCPEPKPFIFSLVRENSFYESITIPVNNDTEYNYTVNWGDGTIETNLTGPASHTYLEPNQEYRIEISGVFPRIYFGQLVPTDEFDTTFTIYQWGDEAWTSFEDAFGLETTKMIILAEDTPNLSRAPSFKGMFAYAFDLDGTASMHNWDVSTIEDMSFMFWRSDKIDVDITGWDVSNVKNMSHMFSDSKFNQNIADWNVGNVTDMSAMFMRSGINQNIGNWDVSNVTNMSSMFFLTPFNQDISNWNVENVTDMTSMFSGASFFDQDLSDWNVNKVTSMKEMFFGVEDFNQDLGTWNISKLEDAENFLSDTGLSIENYDATLIGWGNLSQLPSDLNFSARGIQYCLGEAARQKLIDDFGWTIIDGGKTLDCNPCQTTQITLSTQQQVDDFATTYDVANCTFEGGVIIEGAEIVNLDGLSALTNINGDLNIVNTAITNIDGLSSLTSLGRFTISNNTVLTNLDGLSSLTESSTFIISDNTSLTNVGGLYSLTFANDLVIQNNASLTNLDGLSSLVAISDSFIIKNNASLTNLDGLSSLGFLDNDLIIESNSKLENVDGLSSLGAVGLSLSIQSNAALTNLDGLSSVTNMFGDLSVINNDILTNLSGLSNLNNVGGEFNISGNNALSDCAIDAVCDADSIVGGTVTISGNTGNCTNIITATAACSEVVEANANLLAAAYLQGSRNPEPTGPILRVEEGNRESYLKFDLSGFTGDITEARLEMVVSGDPGNGTLEVFLASSSNWTETGLNGGNKPATVGQALAAISGTHSLGQTKVWNLDVSNLPSSGELTLIVKHSNGNDVAFGSDESNIAPQLFITSNVVPEVPRPFITTWKTDNPGSTAANQIKIPAFPNVTYGYSVDWGDGNTNIGVTGEITHTYLSPGTYQVKLSGNFPTYFNTAKLISVDQWGSTEWGDVAPRFAGCSNLDVLATDIPDFSNVTTMDRMFMDCTNLMGNSSMNDWDVSNVVEMELVFNGATSFNQNISDWNVSSVNDMGQMFAGAVSFNQNLSSWDVANVRIMIRMFYMATSFNQDISSWDVSNLTHTFSMFEEAISFDQNLGAWNISNLGIADRMFDGTSLSTENYDSLLQGWSSQQLQTGVNFSAGNSQYCLGETARQKLIDDFGWIISDGGKAEDCNPIIAGNADLIEATYLQGSLNPEPTGPILRTEEGNRETYLKFDLSNFVGTITDARLEMQVASDPGNGTVEIFLGADSYWTETGLNGLNKPAIVGSELASISGTHSLGQTKVWNLDVSQISGGDFITLIVKHSNGNDVAFASDETAQAPKLVITSQAAGAVSSNSLSLSPNPASNEIVVGFEVPVKVGAIFIYDVSGKLVQAVPEGKDKSEGDYPMDVSGLPSGMYFVRTFDAEGIPYQKAMVIEN